MIAEASATESADHGPLFDLTKPSDRIAPRPYGHFTALLLPATPRSLR
jgi:hypothetical protein